MMSLDEREQIYQGGNQPSENEIFLMGDPLNAFLNWIIEVNVADEEEARLGRLFNALAVVSLGIVAALMLTFLLVLRSRGALSSMWVMVFPLAFMFLIVLCIVMAKRGFVRPVIAFYIGSSYLAVAVAVSRLGGHFSPAWLLFFWPVTVAAVLLDYSHARHRGRAYDSERPGHSWYAIGMAGGVLLYYLLLYALEAYDKFTPYFLVDLRAFRLLSLSLGLLMLFSTAGIAMYLNARHTRGTVTRLRRSVTQLERARQALRRTTEERTAGLDWRLDQFRAIAELTRRIISLSDLETSLDTSARAIVERFGFYHVGIFLFDETGDWAILRAKAGFVPQSSAPNSAASLAGPESPGGSVPLVSDRDDGFYLTQGQRVRIAEQEGIGFVARTGRPRLISQPDEVMPWFRDYTNAQIAHLPEVLSEVILPLEVKGQIIGVLDILLNSRQFSAQRRQPQHGTFDEEIIEMLQILADNVAVVIKNAMVFDETRQVMERLGRYQETETLNAWRRALARRNMELNYVYVGGDVRVDEGDRSAPLEEVSAIPDKPMVRERYYEDGVLSDDPATTKSASVDTRYELMVPVQMQQRTVGVLTFEKRLPWRQDEIQLTESVVQQLGLALENARLLEETQTRALQERSRSEIVSQLRALNSVDAILRSAARQLGRALKVERSRIQLTPEDSRSAGGGATSSVSGRNVPSAGGNEA